MPNYVRNRISFEGDPEKIREMLRMIRVDGCGEGSIDFDRILPMPGSLNIEAGSRTDEGLRMYRGYVQAKERNADTAKFLRYRDEHPDCWDLGEKAYGNILAYGAPTWYEWRVENWGTKWPAMQEDIPLSEKEIVFDTAWAFPEGIAARLSAICPEVTLTAEWADEDMGRNCGRAVFRDGEITGGYIPSGRKEAAAFASAVRSDPPGSHAIWPEGPGMPEAPGKDGRER